MRKTVTVGLAAVLVVLGLTGSSFAAGPDPAAARRQNQPTGTIKGDARNSQGQALPQTKVRVRNASSGAIAADLVTDGAGGFVGVVPAGGYIVELVGSTGTVIGLSPVVTVTAGTTAMVSVTASAVGAVASKDRGGLSIFGLGTAMSLVVIGGATTATIVGIKAATNDASGSK